MQTVQVSTRHAAVPPAVWEVKKVFTWQFALRELGGKLRLTGRDDRSRASQCFASIKFPTFINGLCVCSHLLS